MAARLGAEVLLSADGALDPELRSDLAAVLGQSGGGGAQGAAAAAAAAEAAARGIPAADAML